MLLQSFDPSNGSLLGGIEVSSPRVIEESITLAKTAYVSWRSLPIEERAKIVSEAFKSLVPHQEKLAQLLCQEMGKKYDRGISEVRGSIFAGAHYATEAKNALTTDKLRNIEYRSLGVCAVISPWNYPMAMAVNLIVPALIAGNTVVFKPSEETPLVAQMMVELLNESLPNGLLNIVHGDGTIGRYLVESDDINLIAFTGSLAVGKDIMKRSAKNLKRLIMELGGNDPMIVLDDANIDAAAHFAVASSFENSGQMCTSTERVYVLSGVADKFIKKVTEVAAAYKVGPWNESESQLGPIINQKQLSKIKAQIDDALSKGAKLLVGGDILEGRYFQPTVITDIRPDMALERDETFGPVVAISIVENKEEAITRANNSPYGLGASIFGQHDVREVASEIEAGMIGINKGPGGSGDSPWVGAKQSGYGFHGSKDGHRQFAQVTVVE